MKRFTMRRWSLPLMLALVQAASLAAEPAVCSSDGQPPPTALLERFINADCADCWSSEPPAPVADALALDWIAPGALGDDGPLSVAARRDASDRLQALGLPLPEQTSVLGRAVASGGKPPRLRVAHGLPVGNYIGTSIELQGVAPGHWRGWLLLVEVLPPGLAGSPVERHLVRNSLQLDWTVAPSAADAPPLKELRPMQIPAGAQAARLTVVGLLEGASGPPARIVAIARSRCGPDR